ncbi:MAG TPA: Spy/CpxP family protein refolding chaperone [Longimicrobiales bacterium]|nr:Spy/CpxP family protein refolding chaperone [Longimicrobiales bacterium]
MTTMKRLTTAFAMLTLAAAPVAGQQTQRGMPHSQGGMMNQGTIRMCHAMMGSGGGMSGHAGMGGSEAMMGEAMPGPGMMGRAMMGQVGGHGVMDMTQWMGPTPAAVLGAAESLQLTPDQKTRLEELAKTTNENLQAHMQAAMAAHQKASEALTGDTPDLQAYQRGLQEAAGHMVQAQVAETRGSLDAGAVLTAEQRTEMQESIALMRSMMCGTMG